jgi:DNA polymerase elongation subunit (family B)
VDIQLAVNIACVFLDCTNRQEKLAALPEDQPLRSALSDFFGIWRQSVADLRAGRHPLEQLLVTQRVSRTPDEYRTASPAALALAQLAESGGQRPLLIDQVTFAGLQREEMRKLLNIIAGLLILIGSI